MNLSTSGTVHYTSYFFAYGKEVCCIMKTYNNGIDLWHGEEFEPQKYGASVFFNDLTGNYFGFILDESGKIIGDFYAEDSLWIEKMFQVSWDVA